MPACRAGIQHRMPPMLSQLDGVRPKQRSRLPVTPSLEEAKTRRGGSGRSLSWADSPDREAYIGLPSPRGTMFFRKTLKVGPLRFTLTDKGVGTSIGAGPARVGQSATGNRTGSLAGLGFQHRQHLGQTKRQGVAARLMGGALFLGAVALKRVFRHES